MPLKGTLRKYGLTPEEWMAIARRQGYVCFVCRRLPENGRLCTDHDHVKGWKKMPAHERKLHVRGLLCFFCNHYYMGRSINVEKAKNVLEFLTQHAARLKAVNYVLAVKKVRSPKR